MDATMPTNLPASFLLITGLIQFAFIIWIFIFPVLIIKKLSEILEILKKDKNIE